MNQFLDFIVERPIFKGLKSEANLVKYQKELLYDEIKDQVLDSGLYYRIRDAYYNSIITPGDCVGIAGAQAMGEFSTQATLNTFHVAGFDSGINRGVNRFQEIINASKNPKSIECRIFFKEKLKDPSCLRNIELTLFNDLYKNMYLVEEPATWYKVCILIFNKKKSLITIESDLNAFHIIRYELRKDVLYKIRFYPNQIKDVLEEHFPVCCLFSPFVKKGKIYFDILIPKQLELSQVKTEILQKLESFRICGLPTVKNAIYHHVEEHDEYVLDTIGGTLREFSVLPHVDLERSFSNSIWDIYNVLGIEAVKTFLIQELRNVMHGVDDHNILLLVCRMTHSGSINSITRYTMRTENGPMIKASFEESMETFIKAAKFGEVDNFKGVSTAIIGGKKPKIGTNSFDLFIDI